MQYMENIFKRPKAAQSAQERNALSRLRQLMGDSGFLQASLFEHRRKCGKSYCRCARSRRHWHRTWYVGFSTSGGPRQKSIPLEWVEPVRRWIGRYREAETLLRELSLLHWKRLKSAGR